MRGLTIPKFGGPEVLKIVESPDPEPGAGEVLVDVKRAGLNFAEISARVGLYPDAPKPPFIAGYEAAGTVMKLGSGVSGFAVGDRVVAMCRFGAHASRVVAKTGLLKKLPAAMSFDEAAALPVNYLTAHHMLFHVTSLKPGQRVLIHMAAGGVGLAAIQLAKTVKDVELFGTSSAGKHDFLRKAGLQHPIDYRTSDYSTEVRRITGGRGVDTVLDALGGDDWRKGYELLNPGGHLVCFGWANMISGETRNVFHIVREFFTQPKYAPMKLMDKNKSVAGVNLGHLWDEIDLLSPQLDHLLELYAAGVVRPHVDKVFKLADGAAAHKYVQDRKNVGKVVFDCE